MPRLGDGSVPLPTLTLEVDQTRRSVELTVSPHPLYNADTISIRRTAPGYATTLVRGASSATATSGSLFIYDHEPPLGLTSEYQARAYYSDGDISAWTAVVPAAIGCDPNEVWLKDIGVPDRSMRLILRNLGGRRRAARRELHAVKGRKNLVAISDVRSGADEAVVFGTRNVDEKEALDALIDTGQVLLMQVPPTWDRKDAFQSLGDSREVRLRQYGPIGYRDWEIDITESDPPVSGRSGSGTITYATVDSTFSSYGTLRTDRPTYLSVLAGTSAVQ